MKTLILALTILSGFGGIKATQNQEKVYTLPAPSLKGNVSVEEALQSRRSRRQFDDRELSTEQLLQILWSSYGITLKKDSNPNLRGGLRTAPSAGALYPLEIYVFVGKVKGIDPGVYKYIPKDHSIVLVMDKDLRSELSAAALNQKMIKDAPTVLVYTSVLERSGKYGQRGKERYIFMDLGHSAENVYLQAEALKLGTCAVGAFSDEAVKKLMQLPEGEEPVYLMPIGYCK